MSKRIAPCILLFLLPLTLSGCWSKFEINDRTFISGVFVDLADDSSMVELSILTILPNRISSSASGGVSTSGTIPYGVVTKTGRTLSEAFMSIQTDLTRRISWGQTRVLVVGRDYAEKGMKELLEWTSRQPSFPLKAHLYVAPRKAKELTTLTPVYEQSPSEVLSEFANLHTSVETDMKQFLQGDNSKLGNAVPLLMMSEIPMVSEKGRLSPWAGKNGAALFQQEKMVGTLDNEAAYLVAWVQQTPRYLIYSIPLDGGYCSVMLEELKSKIRPHVDGDRIRFTLSLTGEGKVLGSDTLLDITNSDTLHKAEADLNAKLKKELQDLLRKTQKVQADIFQLGSLVEWWYPRTWEQLRENWSSEYREQVSFDVNVAVTIQHLNAEGKPYWMID